MRSRFAAAAAKRRRKKRLRDNAPRISPTIELDYLRAVRRVVTAFHAEIRKAVEPQLRQDAAHPLLWSKLTDKTKRVAKAFRDVAVQTAQRLMAYSLSEATRTLGELANNLPDVVDGFVDEFADAAVTKLGSMLEDTVTEVQAAEEGGAAFSLTDLLGAWVSRALNSATNQITQSTAELNQDRQEDAGISSYVWIAQLDDHTRPEHAALDGQECNYSDPPLTADKSSSGEPCNAGDDYGCRCRASPIIRIEAEPADDEEEPA